jgi:MFS family permease
LPDGASEANQGNSTLQTQGFSLRETTRTSQFWMLSVMFFCFGYSMHAILVHIVIHATSLGIALVDAAKILVVMGGLNIVGRLVLGVGSDRIGNKRGLIIAFVLLSASVLLLQFAREMWSLQIFAVLFGLANGGVIVLMSSVGADLFGLRSHGAILGIYTFLFSVGGAIGSVVSGRLFDITNSYQLAFWVFAALGIAGLILSLLLKPIRAKV